MSRSTVTLSCPTLVNTSEAAKILGRSPATLKRWRYEGMGRNGPKYIEIEGRISSPKPWKKIIPWIAKHRS